MKGNKIVLDLEFTPLRDPDLQAVAGNEIIEIGAVKLDEENRKLDRFQTYVKPQYSDIPYRITQITGITKKTVEKAPQYAEAMEQFADWIGSDVRSRFYTWSTSDQNVILREADLKEKRYTLVFLPNLTAICTLAMPKHCTLTLQLLKNITVYATCVWMIPIRQKKTLSM